MTPDNSILCLLCTKESGISLHLQPLFPSVSTPLPFAANQPCQTPEQTSQQPSAGRPWISEVRLLISLRKSLLSLIFLYCVFSIYLSLYFSILFPSHSTLFVSIVSLAVLSRVLNCVRLYVPCPRVGVDTGWKASLKDRAACRVPALRAGTDIRCL